MEVSGAQKVFITKCTFYNSSDELLSVVRGADYVTISWCKFYFTSTGSHNFAHRIGNRDDRTSDRGKLRVTLHHNWYSNNIKGRMPRVRYGQVHIYNCYYNSIGNDYCIGLRVECHIRVESCYFEKINDAWADYGGVSKKNGEIGWNNLMFVNCSQPTFVKNSFPVFDPPYTYEMDSVEDVKSIVVAGAGNVGNTTSIVKSEDTSQSKFKLYSIYPNPFNVQTRIKFSISQASYVNISVYDSKGRLIKTLLNGNINSGTHTLIWEASDMASGIYIIRMSTENFIKTLKCLLIK